MKNTIGVKLLLIGALSILLLIPTLMIMGLSSERENRSREVRHEISQKWGGAQVIGGPVLSIPYNSGILEDGTYTKVNHFLPKNLWIEGDIKSEIRKRGIFETVLYTADLKLKGSIEPGFKNMSENDVYWNEAKLSVGLSDIKGLKEIPEIKWNNQTIKLKSGEGDSYVFNTNAGRTIIANKNETYTFEVNLKLNGSEAIRFTPMAEETTVNLSANWPNPKFDGAFLPESHEISEDGFSATWKILGINRDYPQIWQNTYYNTHASEFGVELLQTVDIYQQTERSIKYAILFIVLSFLTYFMVEVLKKLKIHPIQYLLVGFAIVLFYLLLLTLSEHLNFGLAYTLASISIVGIISLYTGAILKQKTMGVLLGFILAALYVYLYTLLQLEDYALLIGSIGLFVILSTVMYLTRKIDWYKLSDQ